MKKENILNLILIIALAATVAVGTASAATTISTNITTEGVLTVSGTATSSFIGAVGVGTTTLNSMFGVSDLIEFNNADFNTKIGYQAGKNVASAARYNTFLGYQAGLSSSTASTNEALYNTGIGTYSLNSNTIGDSNTALGLSSLRFNTSGRNNTAVGLSALRLNTTGGGNTSVGMSALYSNTTGNSNTALGVDSLRSNSTGTGNVAIGRYSGKYELGSNSFYVNNIDQLNTAAEKAYSLLYGTFSGVAGSLTGQQLVINGNVGIGTSSPTEMLDINSNNIRIRTAKTPSSATDTCDQGEISWDADYTYVCVATNTWKRSALTTW